MWKFQERMPAVPRRDPTDKEYFTDEDSGDLLKALVRESIQNSLDAGIDSEMVSIRFFLGESKLNAAQHDLFFSELVPHVGARDSGIKNSTSLRDTNIRFLAIEDFGTSGLEGDAFSDVEPSDDESNQFYYFWRHIGKGGKSGSELGRWGLGKTVFPAISEVGTYLGLTTRQSDSAMMLMGLSVLKHHHVDDVEYQPYGYFSETSSENIPIPIEIGDTITDLISTFKLNRDTESGLSVVVIAPSEEVTLDHLVSEILNQFYFAIVLGNLSVTVADETQEHVLDRTYVLEHLQELKDDSRSVADGIELAIWFAEGPEIHNLMMTDFDPERGPSESSQDTLNTISESFENFKPFAVRIPIEVFPKIGSRKIGSILLIGKKGYSSDRAYVSNIRQGLSIPGMRTLCPSGSRFIAYAIESTVAEFLGDAENPAHTSWSATDRVRDKYRKPNVTIDQVKLALPRFYSLLLGKEDELDDSLLRSYFPASSDGSNVKRKIPKKKPGRGEEVGQPTPPDTRPLRRFSISDLRDGFRVSEGEPDSTLPSEIQIKVAYDTVGSNPFRNYERFDFQLDKTPISIRASNCITQQKLGMIVIYAIKSGFEVRVEGFDPDRDLITDGRVIK